MSFLKYYRICKKFVDHDLTNNKSLIQFYSFNQLKCPSFYNSLVGVLVEYWYHRIRTKE